MGLNLLLHPASCCGVKTFCVSTIVGLALIALAIVLFALLIMCVVLGYRAAKGAKRRAKAERELTTREHLLRVGRQQGTTIETGW